MDELDLLKKDWNKQNASLPMVSFDQIYKMIHKKSSSIVKWILIICIVELFFWTGLNLLIPDSYLVVYEKLQLKEFFQLIQFIHYGIVVVFIYFFYKNYKAISVFDSTSSLMRKIIKTRKTVNYYVYYNILMYVILSVVLNLFMFSKPTILIELYNNGAAHMDDDKFLTIMLVVQIVTLIMVLGLLFLYYRIIYGILLKRLSKNYKELENLE